MTCPNCRREAELLMLTNRGQRCYGCKNPALDIPGNLRAKASEMRKFSEELRRSGNESDAAAAYALDQFSKNLQNEADQIVKDASGK